MSFKGVFPPLGEITLRRGLRENKVDGRLLIVFCMRPCRTIQRDSL